MEKKMIFNPAFPPYAREKYDNFCLLRFFKSKDEREYFFSGKLYMRQQTKYSIEELGDSISDFTEGADLIVMPQNEDSFPDIRWVEKDGKQYVKVMDYAKRPDNDTDCGIFINRSARSQRRKIFCMYTLWCNTCNDLLVHIDKEKMKTCGEYGVIITNTHVFFDRIALACNDNPTIYNLRCDFVNYIAEQKNAMIMNPFLKLAAKYSHQNEFRLCAETDNTELLELDTHASFRDIAIPIRLNEFADTVSYKNGRLTFQKDIE